MHAGGDGAEGGGRGLGVKVSRRVPPVCFCPSIFHGN